MGNASTEQRMVAIFRAARVTGWRRNVELPGRPDFAFTKVKVAVFVDGCFWHGCPRCYRAPVQNADYWREKVARNRQRDRASSRALLRRGWQVVRLWEHQLKDGGRAAAKVAGMLAAGREHLDTGLKRDCPARVVSAPRLGEMRE